MKILAGILGSTDVQRVHVKVTSTNYSLCYLQYSYNRQLHTHSTPGFKVKIAPTIHTLPLQFNTVAYHAMSDWQIIPEGREGKVEDMLLSLVKMWVPSYIENTSCGAIRCAVLAGWKHVICQMNKAWNLIWGGEGVGGRFCKEGMEEKEKKEKNRGWGVNITIDSLVEGCEVGAFGVGKDRCIYTPVLAKSIVQVCILGQC